MSTDAQGRILYTASADATIRSWNINQGQLLKVYHCHSTEIDTLSVYIRDSTSVTCNIPPYLFMKISIEIGELYIHFTNF